MAQQRLIVKAAVWNTSSNGEVVLLPYSSMHHGQRLIDESRGGELHATGVVAKDHAPPSGELNAASITPPQQDSATRCAGGCAHPVDTIATTADLAKTTIKRSRTTRYKKCSGCVRYSSGIYS